MGSRRGSRRHIATWAVRGRHKDVPVEPDPGTYYGHVLGSHDLDLHSRSHTTVPGEGSSHGVGWGQL